MREKAVADQTHHILPVVVALVGDFLQKQGTDGDHRRKGISKKEKLQKEAAAQDAECGGYDNGDDSENFKNWRGKLKQPQIRQREKTDSAVSRTKQHRARGQH